MPLPKYEDWKAPWEKEDGSGEFDAEKARKFIYDLKVSEDRLQGTVRTKDATISTLTSEKDEAQNKLNEKLREGESETDRLKRENAELKEKAAKAPETDVDRLRLEVALEKGITGTRWKRLVGSTRDELEADADALLTEWGGAGDTGGGDDDGETPPRQKPTRVVNPGDPKPEDAPPVDFDKALASIPRPGGF